MFDSRWIVDETLSRASTLPSSLYSDPEVLGAETRNVFARTWQLIGRADQIARVGQYFTTTVAGEPVLIVRGKDDVVRALSNVCRHRAGPVAAGSGVKPVLQCGYHGWTYGLDGSLHATPEFEGVECFDRSEVALPRFRIELWANLLFVNLDPAAPSLLEVLGDIVSRTAGRDFGAYQFAARKDWELNCNWKVYVDNYLEGYHIPIVHPSLFRELDYANYKTETGRYHSIQHAPIRRADRIRVQPQSEGPEAQYFWLFPNLMINVYPDNFSTNIIVPLGHQRTLTLFEWYFADPDTRKSEIEETIRFSDEIQLEDVAICEAVQRGLQSTTYSAGRFSVQRENGVHHFHRLMGEFMNTSEKKNEE